MKTIALVAATTALLLHGGRAAAGELPTFEMLGFPITAVQVQLVGSAHVKEWPVAPTLTLDEIPASGPEIAGADRTERQGNPAEKQGRPRGSQLAGLGG
jgi:hypothetical protein